MKKSIGPQTLLYPHPVLVIGTYGADGRPNLMTASWGGICCSKPPCVAVSMRKATLTHSNIRANRAFTVNIPSVSHVKEADYVGMASGHDTDKFKAAGLTPVRSEKVNAPYVEDFPLSLECKLIIETEVGSHTQFILDDKGQPLIEKVRPFIYASGGNRSYHAIGDMIAEAFSVGQALKPK
jgi:flavin reductase (DIM6/NTAB) family NADH-FMN oxidoreductase RutF